MTTLSASQLANHSRIQDSYFATVTNPPFDPRRYSTHPDYAGMQQGLLIRDSNPTTTLLSADQKTKNDIVLPNGVKPRVKLRFLYNPSDFQVNYSPMDSVIVDPNTDATNATSASAATLLLSSPTTCSFALIFDRMYEVNAALTKPGTKNSQITGVNVDVDVFTQLIGIPESGNGFPLYLPIQLYLGGVNAPTFYGVIESSSVTYSHFTVEMVPLRAVINVSSMRQWIDSSPSTVPGTPGKTTGTNTPPRIGTLPSTTITPPFIVPQNPPFTIAPDQTIH